MSDITINGNIESLKESLLNEIEQMYEIEIGKDDFLPEELVLKLADITGKINRELAVYINRKGNIIDISIGDSSTVTLGAVEGRRDKSRLSGVRCVHTHPNGDGMLSSVDLNSLLSLKLDAMTALGVKEGAVLEIYTALPVRGKNGEFSEAEIYGPIDLENGKLNTLFEIIRERDKPQRDAGYENEDSGERAILVGLETFQGRVINGKSEGERSLEELRELAYTAGAAVLHTVLQKKTRKDPAYHIGKGKVEELGLLRQALDANVLIFDDELSGAQVRNIEEVTGIKVIDRTMLILDIFAQRARSKEGKLQVELAQLKYRLPRLIGLGSQLSRLGGGIGTRGPGEKKLEVDRRHIRRRLSYLETELGNISKRRGLMREGRRKNATPVIALVGYTNAGKSTLMNRLCRSDVFAEDKLFATLDPTTRGLHLPDGREALMTDTVGFIRKLPHELVEAFKSTLEEVTYADVLLHVADISSEEAEEQIAVVNDILGSLGALNRPVVLVLNKTDLVREEVRMPLAYAGMENFEVSAVTGRGVEALLQGIAGILPVGEEEVHLIVPYNEGWVVPYLYENGKILEQAYTETGTRVRALVKKIKIEKIRKYTV